MIYTYIPQVMGAYNSTQPSNAGVCLHMMFNGHEKSLPLTFFYLKKRKGFIATSICNGCNRMSARAERFMETQHATSSGEAEEKV